MAYTAVGIGKSGKLVLVEHLVDKPHFFIIVDLTRLVSDGDTRAFLPAMLKSEQAEIQVVSHLLFFLGDDSDYTALLLPFKLVLRQYD